MTASASELIFDPTVLYFEPPYTGVKKDVLVIQNTTASKFAFKIKTTSPKVYCVKPNCGFIGPAGTEFDTVEITLLFNASDGASAANKKDKFLIEWIAVLDSDDQSDAKALWSAVAKDRPAKSHKLAAHVARRPDSVATSSDPTSAIAARRGRAASKLASSATAPDDLAAFDDAAPPAAAAVVVAAAPVQSPPQPVPLQLTPPVVAPVAPVASAPREPQPDLSGELAALRAQVTQLTQEREQLASQLAAAQRAVASAAKTAAAAASSTSRQSSAVATAAAAPTQLYLIAAVVAAILAFLLGRFV